ncbi:hypothetical protein BDN72DRAFT_847142 [Pluteus cervinus]|uniref:Uncharacterized protein n=1 Tax=Pluteus cervinus TaxID=181527 RepID=A0ACD3AF13_9AGAR|nr:hypothetical protein BDN72DRAFT_847142 [Pluteus cervinus]
MPPSTRRRSIVPVPVAVDQAEIHEESDEEMASWEDEEVATTDDDEDDNWGSKKRKAPKKRDVRPPAKRARTGTRDVAASATPARKARRTRQGKLSPIMDLPLDVLFEVCNVSHEIIKRLLALGHDERDVNELRFRSESDKPLTDRGWAMIRAGLEKGVNNIKATRLEREKADRVSTRRKIFNEAFQDYRKCLRPSQWATLPAFERVCSTPPFNTMLMDDMEPPVDKAQFVQALEDHLPELTPALVEETRKTLISNVKTLLATTLFTAQPEAASTAEEAGVDVLDLAVTVLYCGNHYPPTPLWGFDAFWQHKCSGPLLRTYSYVPSFLKTSKESGIWEAGSKLAVVLIKLVGKDPTKTTFTEMDELDARFVWDTSIGGLGGSGRSYPICNWRKAVVMSMGHYASRGAWRVLNEEEIGACKAKEKVGHNNVPNWTCAHCAEYANGFATKLVVEHHVKTLHGLPEPVEPTDLFISPEVLPTFPDFGVLVVPGAPPRPQNKTFYCKMCLNPKGRLFLESGVKSHLKDRHKVLVSIEGEHWAEI